MRSQITQVINEALKSREEFFTREQEIQIYLADYLNRKKWFDNVYLEYHIPSNSIEKYPWKDSNNIYIDIVICSEGKYYPIEIKYKTISQTIPIKIFGSSRSVILGHHGAQNIGCYDFWKDIKRLELFEQTFEKVEKGIMIFITNDESYLQPPRNNEVGYAQFSIDENRVVKCGQKLDWNGALSISVNRPPIQLSNGYSLNWREMQLKQHKYLLI
ncbi:MAG: hypothetical protein ACK5H3_02195 [Flavobacteriia bacterium]|jgi:hypothetical protein